MIQAIWLGPAAGVAGLAVGWLARSRIAAGARVRADGQQLIDLARLESMLARGEADRQVGAELELRRDLAVSAATIDTLRTEIETHAHAVREARLAREAMRERCTQLSGEIELVTARWKDASGAIERLVDRDREVRMLTESIAGVSARLAQAVVGRNAAEAERTRSALQAEVLERQLRDTTAAARAERDRAVRQSEVAHLQRLADLATELGVARAQAERLEPLRRQVEDREALILAVARERDEAAGALIRRESDLLATIEALQARVGELIRLETVARGLEADLGQARSRLGEVERERDRLRTDQDRAAAQIASLNAEGRDRDTRFRVLLTDRRATVEASQGELARLKTMVTSSRRRDPEASDDLKRITGIGPSLERILRQHGIYSFRQIALWTEADIERISGELGAFRSRIKRDQWIAQARLEHERLHGEAVEQ